MKYTDLDEFTIHYLIAAMWSTSDGSDETGGDPIDKTFDLCDFSEPALLAACRDCDAFREQAGELLNNLDNEQAGHDFWLTREHHGAGFWDRGLGEVGDKLTKIAYSFGEGDLYVGDDGLLHFSSE
jgi:hypothetical protein